MNQNTNVGAGAAAAAATSTTGSILSYLYNGESSLGTTAFYAFSIFKFSVTFYMFYKGKLPLWFARYYGRVIHYVTFPLLLIFQYSGLRGNLIDRVDEHVYLGAMPMYWDISQLKQNRIEAVVNLCDEYSGPQGVYARVGIKQLHIMVVDHYEPSVQEILTCIQFIEQAVQNNQNVFVHCKAGRGRSAAVLICWIAYSKNMTLEQAQKYLVERRSKVRKTLYKQKNVLSFYSKYCCKSSSNN